MTKDFGRDWGNEPPKETDALIDPSSNTSDTPPPRYWRLSYSARLALEQGISSQVPPSTETNSGTINPIDELDAI